MNIGVIGGSGFIGSHLVDKLLQDDYEVTVFDIKKPHRSDINHIYIDITDLSKSTIALTGYYDAIYMLAAAADVNDIYRNPVETTEVNISGVVNILEAARRSNIPRVILASTIWVYSLTTETNPIEESPFYTERAGHIYNAQKIAAELLCHSYKEMYDQNFTILRYGIPYGPRARGKTVLATFVKRAFEGEPLVIFGDGMQYRNFIYIEDLAQGNVATLQNIAQNQTYNLDGKKPITIKEMAETVQRLIGNVEVKYEAAREADFQGKIASSQKAKEELGWEPKVEFEEGVRRYIEWYREVVLRGQK